MLEENLFTIAIPKGRLLPDCQRVLSGAGFQCGELQEDTRKLVFDVDDARFILARPTDVPVYVEYGAADVGIVGKDVLMEEARDVYELVDLGFGFCRFVVAAPSTLAAEMSRILDTPGGSSHRALRVATKFPRVAETYFNARGINVKIIPLHGATELAPQAGLSDLIVDIVSTGRTLAENDLVVVSEIATATARLIANRASFGLKIARIRALLDAIRPLANGNKNERKPAADDRGRISQDWKIREPAMKQDRKMREPTMEQDGKTGEPEIEAGDGA
ncbi:MAG TPA: ATP phosphoribosyltransferase [Firmicutes bacterium]|nr:ATP phosphoribosyltransferase [Bacillota bacterium]